MKKLFLLLVLGLGCSSGPKKPSSASEKCMRMLKNTKIKAPKNIRYLGIFTNASEKNILNNNAYSLRIVKHRKKCKALIIDYHTNRKPSLWTISPEFNCNLNQINFQTKYAFYNPFKKQEMPHLRELNFKGYLTKDGDLKGVFSFSPNDEYEKAKASVNQLNQEKNLEHEMAAFDWETIELMDYRMRCTAL